MLEDDFRPVLVHVSINHASQADAQNKSDTHQPNSELRWQDRQACAELTFSIADPECRAADASRYRHCRCMRRPCHRQSSHHRRRRRKEKARQLALYSTAVSIVKGLAEGQMSVHWPEVAEEVQQL